VADRDPAAIAVFLGLVADILDLHAVRHLGEIEMHVDVDVERVRDLEHAIDVAARIGVGIGRGAD